MRGNSYRDGRVHVCARLCDTCIFRPGNLMHLVEGRVEELVAEAIKNESAIICHSTLNTKTEAVCRGFYNRHRTLPLSLARHTNRIAFQNPHTQKD